MAGELNDPPGTVAVPSEEDFLRFGVALLTARDDTDLVDQLIDQELAEIPKFLHDTFLKIALRMVVTEFFAPVARLVDRAAPGFTETGLNLQAAANEGVDLEP